MAEVIAGGYPNDGEVTEEFAARIADICGATYGIGVSSGSAALYCGLAALGIGPGDEVIVPDLTFIASANAVTLTGARAVLVDVRSTDFGLDADILREAIGPKTAAVMPVHVNGRGAATAQIVAIAREHGLAVVEDAAEALGSRLEGRPLGSFGDVACFSFAPTKIVTCGQGGVVATSDVAVARRVREVKDQGRAERGTGGADAHPVFGFNFKLTNVQAAIGLAQLEQLPSRMAHLRALRDWYAEELTGLDGTVQLVPCDDAGGEALAWIDVITDERDALVSHLRERRIDAREFWLPLHVHPPYSSTAPFANATWASERGLWLPSALSLTKDDVAAVGSAVREFVGRLAAH